MKRPILLMLLAGVAQVGALIPLALVVGYLITTDGPARSGWSLPLPGGPLSPVILLLVWLGGYAIGRRRQAFLTPLLLGAGLCLGWFTLPPSARPAGIVFPLLALPVLAIAWWGGASLGATGLYWHTAVEGLRRSLWICLAGLVLLWLGAPPVSGAFAGPLLLFGAGLTLMFLLRLGAERVPLGVAAVVLAPLIVMALIALLVDPALVGSALRLITRTIAPAVEVIALPIGYLVEYLHRLILYWLLLLASRRENQAQPDGPHLEKPQPPELVEPSQQVIHVTATVLFVIALVGIWLLIRRLSAMKRFRPDDQDVDEIRSGPGVLKGILGDLRSLLNRRPNEAAEDALPASHPRRLLRRLQAWGARQGRERRQGETPAQYARSLARQLPPTAEAQGLNSLSAAYGAVRYGSGQPRPEDLAAAERLLNTLEQK